MTYCFSVCQQSTKMDGEIVKNYERSKRSIKHLYNKYLRSRDVIVAWRRNHQQMGFTIQVRYCQEVQSAPTKDWLKWDMFRRRYCFSQSDNESDWLDFDGIQERERDAVGLNHEKIPMPWITRPISHEFYDLFMPNPVSFTAGAPTNLDLLKPKSNISDDEKLKIENPEE